MALYAFDTDTLSLLREGHSELERNVAAHAADEIVTTVITVEEYLTGWYSLVRQARRPDQVELAYKELAEAPAVLARFTILTSIRRIGRRASSTPSVMTSACRIMLAATSIAIFP